MDEREKIDPKGTPFERGGRIRHNAGAWRPLVDVTEIYCGDRGIDRNGEYNLYDAPIGVGLKVEEATKSEPIFEAEMEWETTWESINPLYMWEDGGRYHMIYGCTYGACYAVSEDAYNWTRPEMGWIEHNGSKKNNIIHAQLQHCHGYFEDPSAPPEERFKTMGGGDDMGWYDPATGERLEGAEAMKRTDAMLYEGDAYKGPEALIWGRTHGYVSPDRLHWTRTEPLADRPVNGAISARYDSHNEEYYAYIQIMGYAAGGPTIESSFSKET